VSAQPPRRFRAGARASFLAVALAACAPHVPAFSVQTARTTDAAGLPLIMVAQENGAPLQRDDWIAAEAAARAYCDRQGRRYARLPPSRAHTEMRLEGGRFSFVAQCLAR
jgi:hypothetical protein